MHPDAPERIVEAAYTEHAAGLRRRLISMTRDVAAAEDIGQEAFVRLLVEVRDGRTPMNVGGWLYRVGSNLAISRGRRMTVANRYAGALIERGGAASPEAIAIDHEAQRSVRDAMAALPQTDRIALTLAAYGMGGLEIARSIGRTEGATRSLMCRARARLRAQVLAAGL